MRKSIVSAFLLIAFLTTLVPSFVVYSSASYDCIKVIIEAEDGVLHSKNNLSYGGFNVVSDSDASNGKALWSDKYYMTLDEKVTCVTYPFNISHAGTYNVFVRIKNQDSIHFGINEDNMKSVYFSPVKSGYSWKFIGRTVFNEGGNQIKIANREALSLDKILITDKLDFYPDDNTDENNITNLFPDPDFYPEKGHPKLYVTKNTLDTVRKNLTHEQNAEDYRHVVSAANAQNVEFVYNTSPAKFNKTIGYILGNAFLYLIDNNDKQRAVNAINGLKEYLPTLDLVTESHPSRIFGYAVSVAAEVYDWCYSELTDEDKEFIYKWGLELLSRTEVSIPPVKNNGYANEHSMEAMLLKDMLSFSVAVYDEHPELYDAVAGRIFNEHIKINNYHFENGSKMHVAGDDYGRYRLGYAFFATVIFEKMGCSDVMNSNMKEMAYQSIIRNRPDGYYMSLGDIYSKKHFLPYDYTLSFLAANLYKDKYLKGKYFDLRESFSANFYNYGSDVTPVERLLINDVSVVPFTEMVLPQSSYSGNEQGVMTTRTGWDNNSLMISLKMPERYLCEHSHLDAGTFEIYYKGALALDSGVYNGISFEDENGNYITNTQLGSLHDLNYHKRTIAHNCMLIYDPNETEFGIGTANDGGQRLETSMSAVRDLETYKEVNQIGKVLGAEYGPQLNSPEYSYLKGNITNAYSEKVSDYTRSFLFFDFEDNVYPGALIVMDKVTSKEASFKKTWLLHSQNKPLVSGNTASFSNDNGGKLTNKTLLPKNADITVVGGEGKEYYVGSVGEKDNNGKNYPAIPESGYKLNEEHGNWRIQVSPESENLTDYFLNVIYVSDDNTSDLDLETKMYDTDDFYGVQIKNKIGFLSKFDERVSKTFTVSTEGEGVFDYTICGLKEGTWKITDLKTGKSYQDIASVEGGVINFEGPCGSYTIEQISDITYNVDFSIESGINVSFENTIETGDYLVGVSNDDTYKGEKIKAPYVLITAKLKILPGYSVRYGAKMYVIENGIATLAEPYSVPADGISESGTYGILFYGQGLKKDCRYLAYPYAVFVDEDGAEYTVYGHELDIILNENEEYCTNNYYGRRNIYLFNIGKW